MTEPRLATLAGNAPDFWERTRRAWHVVFYLLLGVLALVTVLGERPSRDMWLSLGCLLVLALAYAVAGWRALGTDRVWVAVAYLVPAWAATFALVSIETTGFVLLFILYPQIWAMLPTGWLPVAWTISVSALLGVQQYLANGADPEAAADATFTAVFNAGLSLLLGLWITGIARESEARALLIEDLQRTRADLAEAEHGRGVLAERERLARDIHDTLAQGFTSILTLAQAAEATLDTDLPAARIRLELLAQTARENLAEARNLVATLAPSPLAGQGLPAALRRVAVRFTEETGVSAETVLTGTPAALPSNVEVVLLRSAQEALANVRKHAAATAVRVELTYRDDGISLCVEDDGQGITGPEGFGLRGMRDRVASVGGSVQVTGGEHGGTRVSVDI